MNLRRSELLVEGLAARTTNDPRGLTRDAPKQGFRFGQSDAATPPTRRGRSVSDSGYDPLGHWGKSSSSDKKPVFTMPLSQSTMRGLNRSRSRSHSDEFHISPTSSRSSTSSGPKVSLSRSDSAVFERDHRFPTKLHHDIHNASPEDAHRALDTLEKRKDPSGAALHNVPGMHHPNESVRMRAWKIHAQNKANSLGGKTARKKPEPKVLVKLLKNRQTGAISSTTSFPYRPHVPVPKGHDVIHTVKSEALARSALLLENFPVKKRSWADDRKALEARLAASRAQQKALSQEMRKRLASATPEVAARLRAYMKRQHDIIRPGVGSRTLSRAQRRATQTVQTNYPGAKTQPLMSPSAETQEMRPAGHRTQELRPAGHQTQKMVAPPAGVAGSETRVQMPVARPGHVRTSKKVRQKQERGLETAMRGRSPEKTQVLQVPRVRTASVELLAPILQEFVATTPSAWKSGIGPNDTINGGPAIRGVTSTANVGHTTAQGAAVPDKKKREIKLPDLSKLPKVRDPVTHQLARLQPANPGGVLTKTKRSSALRG